jgi:hypothetical protein
VREAAPIIGIAFWNAEVDNSIIVEIEIVGTVFNDDIGGRVGDFRRGWTARHE